MSSTSKKIILVSGGAGYIGSHMINLLLDHGFEVIALDNLSNCLVKNIDPRITFVEGDIGDAEVVKNILESKKIYAVFHFAAAIEAGESMINPSFYYKNNVAKTINFLDAIICHSAKSHFIFSSSAAIYKPQNHPIKESEEKIPANVYGKTKLAVEEILNDYAKIYNFSYGALRYFNACGADYENGLGENRKVETHLIPLLLQSLNRENGEFFVNGNDYKTNDGTCVRDYIHVQDICAAHLKMLEYLEKNPAQRCFNVGTGQGHSILEVIQTVEKITGLKTDLKYKKRREGDSDSLVACPDLAMQLLDWKPQFSSLNDIISSAWQWEKIYSNR